MSEKLLPCAHCGSLAKLEYEKQYRILRQDWHDPEEELYIPVRIRCLECGSNLSAAVNKVEAGGANEASKKARDRAIAKWNRRATDSLPTYYLLRRTVGEVTRYHEYWCARDAEWTPFQHFASLFDRKTEVEYFIENLSGIYPMEIIPIKLVEVPHAS